MKYLNEIVYVLVVTAMLLVMAAMASAQTLTPSSVTFNYVEGSSLPSPQVVNINKWTGKASVSVGSLTVAPLQLSAGTYTDSIRLGGSTLPIKTIVTKPPSTATITFSVASLIFNQSVKQSQSMVATGPAGVLIGENDNFTPADTGAPKGTGSVSVTFTPNSLWNTAASEVSYATFAAGTLTRSFQLTFNATGSGTITPPVDPPPTTNGLGSTEPVIAAWDDVPYQNRTARFTTGVVAWHINQAGIASVGFSVDLGQPTGVTAMSMNADSKVNEFAFTVDPTGLAKGQHVLHATVYPVVGRATPLPDLPFNNIDASARTKTITGGSIASAAAALQTQFGSCDDCTILLGPGSYDGTTNGVTTSTGFLTIAPTVGTTRNQVVITGPSGDNLLSSTRRIRFKNVTVKAGVRPADTVSQLKTVWFDNCLLTTDDRWTRNFGGSYFMWAMGTKNTADPYWVGPGYFTDCEITNVMDGPLNASLCRNLVIHKIGQFAISGSLTNINVDAYDLDPGNTGAHGDVYQGYGALGPQQILYGVTAGITHKELTFQTRGINWSGDFSNIVVAGCTIRLTGWGTSFEVDQSVTNMLVKDSTFINAPLFHGDTGNLRCKDVVLDNVVAQNVEGTPGWSNQDPATIPGITLRNGTTP